MLLLATEKPKLFINCTQFMYNSELQTTSYDHLLDVLRHLCPIWILR